MKKRARTVRQAHLSARIRRLTREIEQLVPEIRVALGEGAVRHLLAEPARSLARAAAAVRAVVDEEGSDRWPGGVRALLEGTSPIMSLLGSRIVLSPIGREAAPRPPSAGAQALAALLEEPARTFDAAEIAERLGCSVPAARTTLNRLVKSGHATRLAAGRFRVRAR